MPEFKLTLIIDKADLPVVRSAQVRLTLAKPVNSGDPNVIWLSVDPFQSTTIQWSEKYWIYASTTTMTEGARISKLSEVTPGPAEEQGVYPFTPGAIFGAMKSDLTIPRGTYGAVNNMPFSQYPALTFGLSQSAMVNQSIQNQKPISAQTVLATQEIRMTPFTNMHIWLQGIFVSETIITKIIGRSTVAKFGGRTTDITLKYDGERGLFLPDSVGLLNDGVVELREPVVL